jgi:hypothetical protein
MKTIFASLYLVTILLALPLKAQRRGTTLPEYHPPRYDQRHPTSGAPYQTSEFQKVRYPTTQDWFEKVVKHQPSFIQNGWIFYPALGYTNGFWPLDSYPFFVFNGYRFRYSRIDRCHYELIDRTEQQVLESYPDEICQVGYDSCSKERDHLNEMGQDYRYFCAESLTE